MHASLALPLLFWTIVHATQIRYYKQHHANVLPATNRPHVRAFLQSTFRWGTSYVELSLMHLRISATHLNTFHERFIAYLSSSRANLWPRTLTRWYDIGTLCAISGQALSLAILIYTNFQIMSNFLGTNVSTISPSSILTRRSLSMNPEEFQYQPSSGVLLQPLVSAPSMYYTGFLTFHGRFQE
jgi:hypothetical protein